MVGNFERSEHGHFDDENLKKWRMYILELQNCKLFRC